MKGVLEVIKWGDKIAVLGTNTWAAMKGKKALRWKWKSNTKLESTEDHNKELLKIINGNKFKVNREDGNIEKAFLNLLHNSGYPEVKLDKKIDFYKLYNDRFN